MRHIFCSLTIFLSSHYAFAAVGSFINTEFEVIEIKTASSALDSASIRALSQTKGITMTFWCPITGSLNTALSIQTPTENDSYGTRDFYWQGCREFVSKLANLGVGSGSLIRMSFHGPHKFPGLEVSISDTNLVFVPSGSGGVGVFNPLP